MDDVAQASLTCHVLTPPGMGAIAVIRVRGAGAWALIRGLVRGRGGALPGRAEAGRLYFGAFDDGSGVIDDVIVAANADGAGGSGVVDLSCHGGVRVVERIVVAITLHGASLVREEPQEESVSSMRSAIERRAGDLLAQATTRRGALFLLAQARLLADELESIVALAEAGEIGQVRAALAELLDASAGAEFFVRAAEIAIVGPANAGKSTLANALAGRLGAVVTDQAGTTRDWVTMDVALDGIPITLIDTAGVRLSEDELELLAIRRGQERTLHADLHLLVLDAMTDVGGATDTRWETLLGGRRHIRVLNKVDLLQKAVLPTENQRSGESVVAVSARTGVGVEVLRQAVISSLGITAELDERPAVFCHEMLCRLQSVQHEGSDSDPQIGMAGRIRRAVTGILAADQPGDSGKLGDIMTE